MAKNLGDLQKILIDVERTYTPPDGGKLPAEFWATVEQTICLELATKITADVRNRVSSLSIIELTQLRALVADLRNKGVIVPTAVEPTPVEDPKPKAAEPAPAETPDVTVPVGEVAAAPAAKAKQPKTNTKRKD